MIKAHRKFKKEYPKTMARLLDTFMASTNREFNRYIRDRPKVMAYLESVSGITFFKLYPHLTFTLLTGVEAPVCRKTGCSATVGFGGRSFNEFCSKACFNSSGEGKIRREATMLKRYGVANAFQADAIKERIAEVNIERYGHANPSSSEKIKRKKRRTSLKNFGTEHPMQSAKGKTLHVNAILAKYGVENVRQAESVKAKIAATNLVRYGGTSPMHCESVKSRIRATCMAKYGVDNPRKAEVVKKKIRKTWLDKYGVDHPMRVPEIREKQFAAWRAAILKKYGVDHNWKVPESYEKGRSTMLKRYGGRVTMHCPELILKFRESFVETCMLRYGVPHPMLDPDVLSRVRSNCFKSETIKFGRDIITVQGYEEFVLNKLDERFNFKRVTTNPKKVGIVKYKHEGRDRLFMPDLKLLTASGNTMVVEVKSWFTLSKSNGIRFKKATEFYNKRGVDFYLAIGEPKSDTVKLIKNPDKDLSCLVETAKFLTGS